MMTESSDASKQHDTGSNIFIAYIIMMISPHRLKNSDIQRLNAIQFQYHFKNGTRPRFPILLM